MNTRLVIRINNNLHECHQTSMPVSSDLSQQHPRRSGNMINTPKCSNLLAASDVNQVPTPSGLSDNFQSNYEDRVGTREGLEAENVHSHHTDRIDGAQQPVGRLYDRQVWELRQDIGRHAAEGVSRVSQSDHNAFVNPPSTSGYPTSSTSSSVFNVRDYEVQTSRSREARYQDLLEHRSNLLECRTRSRSQVRALQLMGSGHDRSCSLSGQHTNVHCTCQISNLDNNSNNDTNTRASISRIVMLAEALFEVLDEIHQQSAVLSSHQSVSSTRSLPAPNAVVESLPVRFYTQLQKHQDEAAQCYICLVEYEDRDSMRILPCHHEFHRTCVDKWLKEIHGVCPLCRGDICTSDALSTKQFLVIDCPNNQIH